MIPGRRSFAEHAAQRGQSRKSLSEGRQQINALIRSKFPARYTGAEVQRAAEVADVGRQLASLDQGARSGGHTPGEHAPEVTDANSWLRAAHRENQEGNG
jgi:hypothetical protein